MLLYEDLNTLIQKLQNDPEMSKIVERLRDMRKKSNDDFISHTKVLGREREMQIIAEIDKAMYG